MTFIITRYIFHLPLHSRGASGAGKTTFLNVLAGHAKGGAAVTGSIAVNGEECDGEKMRRISGFVHQVCALAT